MRHHRFRLSLPAAAALALAAAAAGQEQQAPRPKVQPLLRLEAPGPTTLVAALAAGPGESLYAAGFDKVVRVWEFDANAGRFAPRPDRALRTPIGPGLDGALNAVAVSPDGRWAAAAGNSPNRYAAGFRDPGITLPRADAMTDEMLLDQGAVYLFDLRKGSLRVLRGHKGPVMALAFAAGRPGGAPVLVSAAKEEDPKTGDPVGAVRAWDAAAGASLGAYRLPRVNPDVRPALAAGPTGAGPHDLAVFVAWDNGELWRWDLAAGPPRVVSDDQRYNNALAVSPDGAWLLGGTFDARREAQKGQVWSRALRGAGGVRHRAEFPPLALPGGRTSFFVPRGLAPFASRPGGPADRLAVLLRAATTRPGSDAFDESYHLAVLAWDAAAGRPGPELARVQLWDGPGRVPSVAAVAGGRFLAVAGGPGHAVAVFGAAALERGADGPLQRLQSGGRTFRSAAFASRGDAWGLVLDGSLLFDFSGPELRKAADDWKDASPDPRGWQVEETPGGTSLTVRSPAGKRVIDFAPSKWTAHALVPPGEGRPRALLAVGLLSEADQPELRLYDLSTGRQVRRCTGHTARITSLAARADGRLLASTSEDQTVRLWSLADLDRAAVRLGQLDGVGVREEGDRLVVSRVEPDGPAAGKLTRGEPVEGIVIGGELRPYRKAYDFYLAVSRTPPGRDLTLRLGGAKARDVALPVAQGVDERKPLLSLFIFGDDPRPEWVGWSPHGPYDSSAPAAERVIGWHFNPAEPGGPSRFAAAGEYRRDYKRPGILKHLVARADLSAALRDLKGEAPPPDPRMGLRLEGNGDPVLTDGRLLVRRKDVTLALSIDPDFPLDRVASLHWELAGDAKRREFDPALEERAGRVRRAGLAGLPWRRGPLTLRAVLTTGGAEPRTFTQELALHYQPPPPQVELDAAWKKQNPPTAPGGAVYRTVFRGAKPRWAFAADVRPGEPGEEVSVRVRLNGGEWRESGPAVRETFELREGPNLVELEATHAAALKGYEENETARLAVGVVYQPPMVKVNPPEIDLALRVGERERTVLPGAVIVLDDLAAPSVPLRGTIRAAENLALAGLNKEPLKGFRPGAAETFRIEQELALRPGEQEFELRAKTASSEPAVVRFTLKYVPALPAAVVRAPRDGQELVEERDGDEAAVEVQFEPPDDPHPFTVYASVNGEPRGKPEKLDAGARLWKTRLRLEPGANAVRLHLGNAWGAERADGPVTVFLKRPPRIVRAEAGEVGKRPRVDLSAEVESPGELPPTGATLSTAAGEQAFGADAFTKGEADPRTGRVTWRFAAPQVPLEQGKNRFRLVVRNADGPSAAKDFPELAYEPPPPPKAAITFSGPPDQTVDVPRYPVSFTVRSASPLERVTVAHNGAVVHEVPAAELKKLAPVAGPGGEKEYVLEVEHVVRLEPRPNELRFTARNAGGDATAARTVSYVRVPPRVVIDRIEPFRNPAPAYEPEVGGDQRVIFPEVGPGHVRLVGRLVWGDDREAGLGGRAYVKVWVNGLQQLPTDVRPPASPGATERRFEVELVLNRAEDNLIELKVEGLPETVDAQRRCVVRRCAKPVQGQRLHLAVIGVGVKDGAALQREALRAVGATADERGRYSARPAFEEIELYPPVCGVVEVPNVNRLLNAVRERIRSRRRADLLNPVNDVVLLYYRGRERIDENGTYFLTSNPVEVIRCKDLARDYFPDLPGAQVLLLDVARPGRELPPPSARPRGDEVVHWPGDPNVARMRKARPAEAPRGPEPDLIEALGKALPGPGKLGELSRAVLELFQGQPYARFTPEVPGPLAELPIRGKP